MKRLSYQSWFFARNEKRQDCCVTTWPLKAISMHHPPFESNLRRRPKQFRLLDTDTDTDTDLEKRKSRDIRRRTVYHANTSKTLPRQREINPCLWLR